MGVRIAPEVGLFGVALALALAARVARRWVAPSTFAASVTELHVLLAAPAGSEWHGCVWDLLTRARAPQRVRVYVLLECDSEQDTLEEVDSQLRAHVALSHVRAPSDPHDACRRVRRLVRHFAPPDDARVVVLGDHRARLVPSWDGVLAGEDAKQVLAATGGAAGGAALTAPVCAHAAGFPTLDHDGERVRRGAARAFPADAARAVTAAACWCPELTVADAATLRRWPRAASCVEVAAGVGGLWVPTKPLLEADAALEQTLLRSDPGRPGPPPGGDARVGLASRDDLEATLKYGSARAARLARSFARGKRAKE